MNRPTFEEYFLDLAECVSKRGDCSRRQIGCVLVVNTRVVATGYNGSAPGQPGCLDGACPRALAETTAGLNYESTGCIARHAEMNACATVRRHDVIGATAYINESPCYMCQLVLSAHGISQAIWPAGRMTFGFI